MRGYHPAMADEAWFGRIAKRARHIINPDTKNVFGDDVAAEISARIFPLLTVDLDALGMSSGGKFHFLYTELEELHFRRQGDRYTSIDNYKSVKRFYAGDEPWEPVASWHGTRVTFRKLPLPERQADEDDFDYGYRLRDMAKAKYSGADGTIRMGGPPLWVQSPHIPMSPKGKRMQFVGQIVASTLTTYAADASLYLFHDRATDRVTQVSQFT